MAGYDTNLAAEFHVLSCLHRLGLAASLTLGNKKGVDIFVAGEDGATVTVEVKGVSKKYDWPADNITNTKPNHFVVLVSFNGKIADPTMPPSVWVIPAADLPRFCKDYTGRRNVSHAAVNKEGETFRNAWKLISKQTV